MQAHLHLCFTSRSLLKRAWWKVTALLVLIAFVLSLVALSPQAIATWGSRGHQVIMSNDVLVLHHVASSVATNDVTPSLRSEMPQHPDHVFSLVHSAPLAESSASTGDFEAESAADFCQDCHKLSSSERCIAIARIDSTHSHRVAALHVMWSTVRLML